jgi:hypothetical protein
LLLWPPFSNEMAPDLVNGVNGRALVTKVAPLLMEKLPGNQIEYKLFGFFREPAPSRKAMGAAAGVHLRGLNATVRFPADRATH